MLYLLAEYLGFEGLLNLVRYQTFRAGATMLTALAILFCIGRALFWAGYGRGAGGRALGFALTFYPTIAAFGLSAAMLLLGRSH